MIKSIILKQHTISDNIERTAIYFCGIRIYMCERPSETESKPRQIGFVQYPSDAPGFVDDEDYWEDE